MWETSYQWTGGESDQSGLYYFNAKYYSPELGRFMSADPAVIMGMDVGLSIEEMCNPYMYAKNNPIRYVDHTGLANEDIVITVSVIKGMGSGAHVMMLYRNKIDPMKNVMVDASGDFGKGKIRNHGTVVVKPTAEYSVSLAKYVNWFMTILLMLVLGIPILLEV